MGNNRTKCIIILSTKSSGSSVLQNLLTQLPKVNHVEKTRHHQHETLFWTKAASILEMPQDHILDSNVPFTKNRAKSELITLLQENLESYSPPDDDNKLIFGGWELLCQKYTPVFLEKSPHHLYQWSALRLVAECIQRLTEIDFLFIGLVRNPMDTLYSMWKRWGGIPEKNQYQWYTAYANLLKFKALVEDQLIIIRYEDLINQDSSLKDIYEFIDLQVSPGTELYLHSNSIAKWKQDTYYGFTLSTDVVNFAEKLGYSRDDMVNKSNIFWPLYKYIWRGVRRSTKSVRSSIKTIKRSCTSKL